MSALIERVLQDPVPLGTWLSITTGIMLAVFGYIRTRLQDRKRYTLDVLMRYSHSVELLRSLHAMFARGVKQRDGKRMDQGGLFPFASPLMASIIHWGLRFAGMVSVWPWVTSVQVSSFFPKSFGTTTVKTPQWRRVRKRVG